ncbi:MAG: dihydrolipoyl dehydrogenase [Acetobacteraceae bacterium]|nr:dihydrolipoyl dehydrogenase [Acetobacteraceae bacterium]
MANALSAKVLVIGGGPGGYVAAIRAGQLGLDTILIEGDQLGGTCLIRGCIPSKAVIHAASAFHEMWQATNAGRFGISLPEPPALNFGDTIRWKDGIVRKLNGGVDALLKKAKVRVIKGWAVFSDAKTCAVETQDGPARVTTEHVILANGSEPVELPFLPFGGPVISSTEALSLPTVPRRLAVVGAGYIGLELGIAFRKLGSEVTIIEALDQILPLYDDKLVAPVKRWLDRAGVTVHLGAKALGVRETAEGYALIVGPPERGEIEVAADNILVTVGRRPRTWGWGLENMAVDMTGPFVKIDDQCRTAMKNVWAIGDLVGEPMLAHKASAQGEMVAEIISGKRRTFDPAAIPAVCFTEPEIVSAGLGPGEAKARALDIVTGVFPLAASGRAMTMGAGDDGGFIRVFARRTDRKVVGIQAVGAHVSELSGEFIHALEMGAVAEDIAGTIHVHPTLTEAFHEAALQSLGHAIHI